jgi:hypothetical protein
MPTCDNKHMYAASFGAIGAITGADTLFTGFGLPPVVHYVALAALADSMCKSKSWVPSTPPDIDAGLATESLAAIAGGYAMRLVRLYLPLP